MIKDTKHISYMIEVLTLINRNGDHYGFISEQNCC